MSRQRIVILGREITSLMNLNICLSTENKSKSPMKYSIHNQGIGERVDPFFHIIRKAQVGLFTTEYQRMKRYNDPMYARVGSELSALWTQAESKKSLCVDRKEQKRENA